jgi:type I restriction enzyme S subunit
MELKEGAMQQLLTGPKRLPGIMGEWGVKRLGDMLTIRHGKPQHAVVKPNGKYPILGTGGIMAWTDEYLYDKPSVMIGRKGTIDLPRYMDTPFWTVDTLFYSEVFPDSDAKFLYYYFWLIDWYRYNESSGVPSMIASTVENIELKVPKTKEEQTAIASALSDVDGLIAGLESLLAKKRALKQGAMQQLLTGQKRLPGFTGDWGVKRLGDVLKFQVGAPFSSAYFNEEGLGIRLLKNRDLKADDQVFHYLGPFDKRFLISNGDVLIGMDGDFLPCRWMKGTALLNQRVGRVVVSESLDKTFIYYYLLEPLKAIEAVTSSTTVKHLSHGDVEGIELPLPQKEEQAAIATVLSDMDAELGALEAKLGKTRLLKHGMMQELLTGRTRLI